MPTAIRFITRIQDCNDYGDALSWAGNIGFGGLASPARPIDVKADSSHHNIRLEEYSGTEHWQIGVTSGGNLTFQDRLSNYGLVLVDGGGIGIGTTSPDRLVHAEVSDAETAAVTYGLRLSHISSETVASNFGTGIESELEDDGGGRDIASQIDSAWQVATAGAERGRLIFKVREASGALDAILTLVAHAGGQAIGFFGSAQTQQNHIVDAVTDAAQAAGDPPTKAEFDALVGKCNANWAKFNTLLADNEGYGLLKTS